MSSPLLAPQRDLDVVRLRPRVVVVELQRARFRRRLRHRGAVDVFVRVDVAAGRNGGQRGARWLRHGELWLGVVDVVFATALDGRRDGRRVGASVSSRALGRRGA